MSLSPLELAMIADELPVAIWLGRVPSGEVVYTNRAFREVLGIDPPPGAERGAFVEPYGVHQLDGTPYPEHKMPFERAIAARETIVVDDLVIHRRDGRHVHLRVFAKPIFDAGGTITHVLEAFTDITREIVAEQARVEGERKLARSQRLESLGQLATGIAHDFNNLLTVTTLTVSRLLARVREPDLRSALVDVDTVTTSAIDLVKKLVGYATRAPQPLAQIELGTIVETVAAIAQRTFERRLSIAIDIGPRAAWIHGDRSQLEQVLMNLMVNARDAIPGPDGTGTIVVRTRVQRLAEHAIELCPAGSYVIVEVEDDGPGIDPAIRERVFEPYFTTKTRGPVKGTGLGLSTVLGIVRSHDGYIEARPVRPHGTVIRIAIPEHAPPAQSLPVEPPPQRATEPGHGRVVLVVDDELLVLASTATSLRALGYRVLEARDGAEALHLLRTHADAISVAVLDMVLPGLPAVKVFDGLRELNPHLPVLLVTGAADRDDLETLQQRGHVASLEKPFDGHQLAGKLDDLRVTSG